jgi:hypothetical protein
MSTKREILTTLIAVATSVFLVVGMVLAVTTIGTDISTDGNLTVHGNTTLGGATTDTLTFNASTLSLPNNLNIDSGTLFIDAEYNRVSILGTPQPGAAPASFHVNSAMAVGELYESSLAGGSFDFSDWVWLLQGKRIYTLDGIRSDGDIYIDTGALTIPAGALSDASVVSDDIADGAITSAKILDGTIVASDIATNAIQWTVDIPILVDGAVTTVAADAIGTPTFAHTTIQLDAETIAHLKSAKLIIDYTWAATADGTIQFYDSTAGVVRVSLLLLLLAVSQVNGLKLVLILIWLLEILMSSGLI